VKDLPYATQFSATLEVLNQTGNSIYAHGIAFWTDKKPPPPPPAVCLYAPSVPQVPYCQAGYYSNQLSAVLQPVDGASEYEIELTSSGSVMTVRASASELYVAYAVDEHGAWLERPRWYFIDLGGPAADGQQLRYRIRARTAKCASDWSASSVIDISPAYAYGWQCPSVGYCSDPSCRYRAPI
jgi:hypothetical protein